MIAYIWFVFFVVVAPCFISFTDQTSEFQLFLSLTHRSNDFQPESTLPAATLATSAPVHHLQVIKTDKKDTYDLCPSKPK